MSDLFIGIEAVRMRQSFAVASDEGGTILGAATGTPISLHSTPRREVRHALFELLTSLAHVSRFSLDRLAEAHIVVGMTGVTFPYESTIDLPQEFRKLELGIDKSLVCTGPSEIIFASHALSAIGSAIICSVGSASYATKSGRHFRVGGWWPVLWDEGSGYQMGRSVLHAIAEEYDRGAQKSTLWIAVAEWLNSPLHDLPSPRLWREASLLWRKRRTEFEELGFDERTALLPFTSEAQHCGFWTWRTLVSGLTIPLMLALSRGCERAKTIVDEAINQLVLQYVQTLNTAGLSPTPNPLVLYGGVFSDPIFRDMMIEALNGHFGKFSNIITNESSGTMRPACGSLLFALGRSDCNELRLPSQEIMDHLVSDHSQLHTDGILRNE